MNTVNNTSNIDAQHILARLNATLQTRKPLNGGDANTSYVTHLLTRGPDAFLKKIGEEATEVVLAAKDLEHVQKSNVAINKSITGQKTFETIGNSSQNDTNSLIDAKRKALIGEMADLWFHSMVALTYFDLSSHDVLVELARREGLSGLEEKALRKAIARESK